MNSITALLRKRHARSIGLGLVISLFVVVGSVVAETEGKKAPAWETTQWTHIETAMGRVNLDGTLRLSFPLGTSTAFKQLGVRFELEHRVETDAKGRARSEWRLRGGQSSLSPTGRTHLRWQPLAGAPVSFEQAKIGWRLSHAGSRHWLIRELDQESYEIRALDGRVWHFRHGVLIGAEHPALGQLRFSTQGALLTQIAQSDNPIGEPLLRARYSDSGKLVSWQIDGEQPQQLSWSEDGQLIAWQHANGNVMQFRYQDNLLSEYVESGGRVQHFLWRENEGYGRGDSRWAAPVHLASDGVNDYTYDLSSKGFLMKRTEIATGAVITTVFNPRLRRLVQRVDGTDCLVVFRKGTSGFALERVDIGGEIAEEYIYDEHDRIIGIRRQGEAELKLSYDEAGRLMALEAEP